MFPDIFIVMLSTIITKNVLECIRQSLLLQSPVHLYKKALDWPNIMYLVQKITKPGFSKLEILISQEKGPADLPKTMVFLDNINNSTNMVLYLWFLLLKSMQNIAHKVIWLFLSFLEPDTRELFM